MSSLIQLLITSAVILMVQSAPVTNDHLQKRDSEITENIIKMNNQKMFEKTVYCAAASLRNTAENLRRNLTLPLSPQININIITKTVLNTAFNEYSKQCKNFTIAMILKHQLQDLLFNTDVTVDMSNTPELSSKNTKRLSTILTNLQTMANTFDDMEFNEYRSSCVKFTPFQYKIMYYVQYNNTSPLESLKDMEKWAILRSYYENHDVQYC